MGADRGDDARRPQRPGERRPAVAHREHADPGWFERYGRRIEDQRLPKGKEARAQYLKTVGADGMRLLTHLEAPYTPQVLKELAEVEILRQIWEQHYKQINAEIRVLDPKERPEAAYCIE